LEDPTQPSGGRLDAWMSLIHFEIALFCAVPDSRWALGAHRVDALPRSNSNELRKWGTFVSPAGLRTIWLHHDLETFSTRLNALSARVAQHGLILTEDQVRALEKTKKRRKLMGRLRFADGDDACTQNRNILMHSETVPLTKSDGRQEVAFKKLSKKPPIPPNLFSSSNKELRKIADATNKSQRFGYELLVHILQNFEAAKLVEEPFLSLNGFPHLIAEETVRTKNPESITALVSQYFQFAYSTPQS
jgi:hypothetical protein